MLKRKILCLITAAVMTVGSLSLAVQATESPSAASAAIYADFGDGFTLVAEPEFGKKVTERTIELDRPVTAIRVVKGDCVELNLDRLTLDGAAPAGYERKLKAEDNDLIEVESALDFALSGKGTLAIAARAPKELKGTDYSFKFPMINYAPISANSQFYTYSRTGAGAFESETLSVPDKSALFLHQMCRPASGHPDAPVDIYLTDDGDTLYAFFEVFMDNTFDHGKDFAAVHLLDGDRVKTYAVHTTDENEYGRWFFDYTDSDPDCAWQHMCYVVEAPLDGFDGDVQIAFEYYGTAYCGPRLMEASFENYTFVDETLISDYYGEKWRERFPNRTVKNLPAAGKIINSGGNATASGRWWIENTGTDEEPDYTLTLNGVNFTSSADQWDEACYRCYGNMNIVLAKGSVNQVGNVSPTTRYGYINHATEINVSGEGKLNVYGQEQALYLDAQDVNVFGRAQLNATASGGPGGVNTAYSAMQCGKLSVSNATVTAVCRTTETREEYRVVGISAWSGIELSHNATLEITVTGGREMYGFYMNRPEQLTLYGTPTLREGTYAPGNEVKELSNIEEKYKEYGQFSSMPYVKLSVKDPFGDVDPESFCSDAVIWAVDHDPQITNGLTDTEFAPNKDCTRGQVVTFLWRAAGCPEPTSTKHPFTDVKESAFYYKAMLWAVENGITNGISATAFGPNKTCTRGQVVTFLWRTKGQSEPKVAEHSFTDVSESGFYYKAMLWAVENGITNGVSDTAFAPNNTCTRGQVVTFLFRAFHIK